jgi:hypothetical protein
VMMLPGLFSSATGSLIRGMRRFEGLLCETAVDGNISFLRSIQSVLPRARHQ